jgi:competence protein ComFC
MYLKFLSKCSEFINNIFSFLFESNNRRLLKLQNIPLNTFAKLVRQGTTNSGTLYIFNYENKIIKDTLYYIKNKRDTKLLNLISTVVSDTLLEELGERSIMENFTEPIIIPIPSTYKQENKRGFNPSHLISKNISELINIKYLDNVLIKIKETEPQKNLSRSARLNNVKNSMGVNKIYLNSIKDKNIIIIDDIVTTGATLLEAKRALLKNGAKKVMCVAVAH